MRRTVTNGARVPGESMIADWSELLSWIGLAVAAPPLLYLGATTLAALMPRRPPAAGRPLRRIAIIIPAHNESLLIGDTVRHALALDYPRDAYTVLVIADNCSDRTAELARNAGARVLERHGDAGKGQGLNEALGLLMREDWEGFLVMDADSQLHPGTLHALNDALAAGSSAVQIRYGVLNPRESIRTRAMELSTASFNALRPLGKARLGLSAGINGNGFCLSRDTVHRVPYLAHSIVEDIEYHMLLLQAGIRVDFLDHVWVKAQMPVGGRGARVQRVRWERGRLLTIRRYAPQLFRAWLSARPLALDGLIDVLMPPVSLVALALVPALVAGDALLRGLALAGVASLALHYAVAARRYASLGGLVLLAGYIPWYVVWKTWVVATSLLTERSLPWIRTDRHKHQGGSGNHK